MGKVIYLEDYLGEKGMVSINEVANYFIYKESMTHKKLQKMCYYAYSWFLTLYDKHLFKDGGFQAWVHGPVNKVLYDRFKGYGWQYIPKRDTKQALPLEVEEFLDMIYDDFHTYSADELELMTHEEKPWIVARTGLSKSETSTNHIDDDTIKSFYTSLMEGAQVE